MFKKIIFAWDPGDNDNIILQSLVCKFLLHFKDHNLSTCILLNFVTTYVLKTFCFISTCQWQYDPRQLCVYCSNTLLRPLMPNSILVYIVKTYVCITIFTFLRHALLCVQCKNDKFFNECVKYKKHFGDLLVCCTFFRPVCTK